MKSFLSFIVLILFLSSCITEAEELSASYVVQGVLQTSKGVQEIKVTELNSSGVEIGVEGAQVILYHTDDVFVFEDQGDGVYRSVVGELTVVPLGFYTLEVFIEDRILRATTIVPEEFFIENQSETSFFVNVDTSGQIIFFCNWDYDGDYGQVIDLYSIEETPMLIPYTEELEDFFDTYSDPIPNKSVSVNDLNMPYYGRYELVINLVQPDYETVFFNDLVNGENNPEEGLDNIDGGKGFFTSVSQRIIELEILE